MNPDQMNDVNLIDEIRISDYQRIFDVMPGNHLLIKADPPRFTMLTACDNYIKMVSRTKESIVGTGVFEAFPPNPDKPDDTSAEDLKKSFLEVISNKKEHFIPVQQYDLSDEERLNFVQKFWQIRNTPILNSKGEVSYILNSVEDITDRINLLRNEEEIKPLKLSHNLYKQAPIGIHLFTGTDLKIILANDLTLKMWGKNSDVIGKPLLEALPELKGEGYEFLMTEVMEKGIPKSFYEWPVVLNRGGKLETGWFNFVYQPYYENYSDNPVGVLVFADEVTEQVKAKKLIEANVMLEQKNKELEQFAYIASHDLQEPLRKVNFYIQMLHNNLGKLDDQSEFYISKVLSSTSRMSDLIRDILDFSRLTANMQDYKRVNLNKLLQDVISDFDVILDEKHAKIEYNQLPVVYGVVLHMQQLFHNLISNALKFTRAEEHPVIKITAEKIAFKDLDGLHTGLLPDTDYHYIVVSDNGIGFSEEYAERIFGIFQRLHGKLEYQGTGIGLALCRKIVENHDGKIWATSKQNKGSQFHILLPVR